MKTKKKLLENYEITSEPYRKSLNNLKIKNKKALEKKKQELAKKESFLKNQFLNDFLKKSKAPPIDYPSDLSLYWKQSEWDTITKMLNAKKSAIKGHENFLIRELGKKNKSLEWFLDTFDEEIKDK